MSLPPLFAHQIEAIERFKDAQIGAIWHSAGLAKSRTTLAIAAHKYRSNQIAQLLVIAPNLVHKSTWYSTEIPKWLGNPESPHHIPYEAILQGSKIKKAFSGSASFHSPLYSKLHIVCVNIDTFSTATKWVPIRDWAIMNPTMVVIDEASLLKNKDAKRTINLTQGFNRIRRSGKTIIESQPLTETRFVLSGTPATNGPHDLFCTYEFLQPNFFKRNYYSFRNYYSMLYRHPMLDKNIMLTLNKDVWEAIKKIKNYSTAANRFSISEDTYDTIQSQDSYQGPYKHSDALLKAIEPISSIKRIEDCLDMPKQTYLTHKVEMTPLQAQAYKDMRQYLLATFNTETGTKVATAANKVTSLIRLQTLTSGFILAEEAGEAASEDPLEEEEEATGEEATPEWISTAKLDALYGDLEIATTNGPVIVITRFTAEAKRIYEDLTRLYKCCLMTGWSKIGTVEAFQQGKYDVMVANIKVISKGLNLQNSYQMFYFSNTFSLEDRIQSEARIYRAGQPHACLYTDYVVEGTVDEAITEALQNKRHFYEQIMHSDLEELV